MIDLSTPTATTTSSLAREDDEACAHAASLTFAPGSGESVRALESARTEVTIGVNSASVIFGFGARARARERSNGCFRRNARY